MIPDYQTLMRPVLELAKDKEIRVADIVEPLADRFDLTERERVQLVPSGKQTVFANRVHWAKTFLNHAGLLTRTRRAHYAITERGLSSLHDQSAGINRAYLEQFEEFRKFQSRSRPVVVAIEDSNSEIERTPEEALRDAHERIENVLREEILERVRSASPSFFERLILELLLAMGYGGRSEEAGQTLGQSGDDGVDGVVDQDVLGVDQIYVQAKCYAEGKNIGAGAIRDFFRGTQPKEGSEGHLRHIVLL